MLSRLDGASFLSLVTGSHEGALGQETFAAHVRLGEATLPFCPDVLFSPALAIIRGPCFLF